MKALGPAITDGLVGYWTMDDRHVDDGTVSDQSGQGNGGTLQGGVTTGADGQVYEAFDFDGVDDKVEIPLTTSLTIGDVVSVSAWVKTTQGGTTGIYECQDAGKRGFRIANSSNTAEFGIYSQDSSDDFTELNGTVVINDGVWHHVAGTYDGSNMVLYVDGVQDGLTTQPNLSPPNRSHYIGVLNGPGTKSPLAGQIDDVRVYNRALSAEEIRAIYNFDGYHQEPAREYDAGQAAHVGTPEFQYGGTEWVDAYLDDGLVGYWPLEGPDAKDYSGNGNDGTLSGGVTTGAEGRVGDAYGFDGADDLVEVGDVLGITGAITISGWVRPEVVENQTIVGKRSGGNNSPWVLRLGTTGTVDFYWGDGSSYYDYGAGSYTTGSWVHAVGVRDGSRIRIYVDGVEVLNQSYSSTPVDSSSSATIGSYNEFGNQLHQGDIDEVRIYDRALDAAEVQALYGQGRVV